MKNYKLGYQKINKEYRKVISSSINYDFAPQKSKLGIIYTFYSDKFNTIEVGFAENNRVIQNKLLKKDLILLDKKIGKKQELYLLIKTLSELNIYCSRKYNFRYSNTLIRHLFTLGWPIGKTLYKQRRIKKELSFA